MVGRAGRPQFDTKGVAVIMTEKHNVDKVKIINLVFTDESSNDHRISLKGKSYRAY
jgi:replicative superfamily II helicase